MGGKQNSNPSYLAKELPYWHTIIFTRVAKCADSLRATYYRHSRATIHDFSEVQKLGLRPGIANTYRFSAAWECICTAVQIQSTGKFSWKGPIPIHFQGLLVGGNFPEGSGPARVLLLREVGKLHIWINFPNKWGTDGHTGRQHQMLATNLRILSGKILEKWFRTSAFFLKGMQF